MMEYTVKALRPEDALIFTDYLETLDFAHAPHWATCFCRFYHTDCPQEQWISRTGESNKQEAIDQIKQGNMKGYLAFDGTRCIGWCNANDARQFIRLEKEMKPFIGDEKTGCVICFVIHPAYRGQGVARLLLRNAIDGFRAEGYDAVLASPVEIREEPEKRYLGTLNMYTEAGFEELAIHDQVHIMRLKLF